MDLDKIIEDTRQSVQRMQALTSKTKALLTSNDRMAVASDAVQADDAREAEQQKQEQEQDNPAEPKE